MVREAVSSSLPLFAVKPLLIIYMMSWAVTNSVGTQLWIYKTCTVNFNTSGKVLYGKEHLKSFFLQNLIILLKFTYRANPSSRPF